MFSICDNSKSMTYCSYYHLLNLKYNTLWPLLQFFWVCIFILMLPHVHFIRATIISHTIHIKNARGTPRA